jgi:hypothetical protein
MDINIDLPPDVSLRSDPNTDGVQISPLAIMVIAEHLKWLLYQAKQGLQTKELVARELNFPSSRKIKVLEYGPGESTILLAKMFPEVAFYAVEGDKPWYDWLVNQVKHEKLNNVQVEFYEQISAYGRHVQGRPEYNMRYVTCIDQLEPPFDLILNDGGMREMVGDYVLNGADKYLGHDGMYFRHDYSMAIERNWIGYHLDPAPDWVNEDERPCYENFCATHPNYEMITVSGNGKWGWRCEYGGVWRRI